MNNTCAEDGGAVAATGNTTVTISSCSLVNNWATGKFGEGGAVDMNDGKCKPSCPTNVFEPFAIERFGCDRFSEPLPCCTQCCCLACSDD